MIMVMVVAMFVMHMGGGIEIAVGNFARADTFHVMVVALLCQAHVRLETQNLFTIFAHLAIHVVGALQCLPNTVGKGIKDQGMVVQIGRLDEFDIRVGGGNLIRVMIYAPDQNAREQEIWEHHDPLVSQPGGMLQARLHQGEGDAGIGHFRPAEADAFPQQAANLGDIAIGVRVRCTAADHHQQCILHRDMITGGGNGFAHPVAGGADQLHIHAKVPAIGDLQVRMPGGIGVEHRGQVVLDMAGGEQHARHGDDALVAPPAQGIQAVADDRGGELQETAVHVVLRQPRLDAFGDALKFSDGVFIPAAVAADHDTNVIHMIASRYVLILFRRTCPRSHIPAILWALRLSIVVLILDSLFPIPGGDGWKFGLLAVTLAYVLDLLFGDPKWLYGRLPHPIVWMGALINKLEGWLRNPRADPQQQTIRGVYLVAIVVGISVLAGNIIAWLANQTGYGWLILGVVGSVFFATRGLHDHVAAVTSGLERGLAPGREAVGHIVGRDPAELDEAGVARAALESLAENFSDGVVAPLFWFLLCGLPGLLAYKAINTMDSMIGHRSERYLYFGQFAARLDDVANWPGARLAGLLICLGALVSPDARAGRAWRVMGRDHGLHTSPNAGWPEGAMAGALDIALAGPRVYHGQTLDGAWIGDGGKRSASHLDIKRGCALYRGTCAIIAFALVGLAFI